MPPVDVEKPDEQIASLVTFLDKEFTRADALIKPDPGRVTARRLNRAEYTNTIRDLLAVDFRADQNFPTDDSGEGFDNIGDILTVSPVLMDKYLSAAGRIAERAISAVPLPKPVEIEYSLRFKNLRRLDPSTVEATHRVDFDAEYDLRIGLPGERPADAKPVTLGLWVDGKLVKTTQVETKPSGLVYFNPYSEEQMRVDAARRRPRAAARLHRRRLRQDAGEGEPLQGQGKQVDRLDHDRRAVSRPRKRSRAASRSWSATRSWAPPASNRILTTLARRAYRRPVTPAEVAALTKFVRSRRPTASRPSRASRWRFRRCWSRRTSCSTSSAIRTRRDPTAVHRLTDVELASRLSYFLWNSMPDDELLSLAEKPAAARAGDARRAGQADARGPEGVRDGGELRRPVAGDPEPGQHQAGPAEVPGLDARAARRDEDRDADVLRLHVAARTGRSASSSTRATRS